MSSPAAPPPAGEDELVAELLGRRPQGAWQVVVRDRAGSPVVIRSSPHLDDGRPMPTIYWLVGRAEQREVGRLEAAGGVRRAEAEVDPVRLAEVHARYAREREALLSPEREHMPSGGVGGTRQGVKCLHAHLAYYLAGNDDPVGEWTAAALGLDRAAYLVSR